MIWACSPGELQACSGLELARGPLLRIGDVSSVPKDKDQPGVLATPLHRAPSTAANVHAPVLILVALKAL